MKNRTPTREQFEQYLQEQDPRVRVRAVENGTHIESIGNGVCDFCSASLPPGRRIFAADSLIIEAPTARQKAVTGDYMSQGGWGACDPCADLIEANDRKGLLERGVAEHLKRFPTRFRPQSLREYIGLAQAAFWLAHERAVRRDSHRQS